MAFVSPRVNGLGTFLLSYYVSSFLGHGMKLGASLHWSADITTSLCLPMKKTPKTPPDVFIAYITLNKNNISCTQKLDIRICALTLQIRLYRISKLALACPVQNN